MEPLEASDGAKWTLGAPRCAQREVKVRKMVPREAPRSSCGPPDGPEGAQEGPA